MRSSALKFGAFAVVAIMVLVVLANTMNNRVAGASRTYEADVASVSGLRTGDDVRAAGVKVGRVEHISLHDNSRARVRFTLSSEQPLYDTTRMVVRYQNLLGQRYLSLVRGPDAVQRVFAITRMDEHLVFVEDPDPLGEEGAA